jgi:hypothetical protein
VGCWRGAGFGGSFEEEVGRAGRFRGARAGGADDGDAVALVDVGPSGSGVGTDRRWEQGQ